MVWLVILLLIAIIGFSFFRSLTKDNADLQNKLASEIFFVVVNMLNEAAYNGKGQITTIDRREFNLYQPGQNQTINFFYSTGNLAITWKYKYFQKEVIHRKVFRDVRNLSLFEQGKIGQNMIDEMQVIVFNHQKNVINF